MSVIVGCPSTFFLLALKLETIWLSLKLYQEAVSSQSTKFQGLDKLNYIPWHE